MIIVSFARFLFIYPYTLVVFMGGRAGRLQYFEVLRSSLNIAFILKLEGYESYVLFWLRYKLEIRFLLIGSSPSVLQVLKQSRHFQNELMIDETVLAGYYRERGKLSILPRRNANIYQQRSNRIVIKRVINSELNLMSPLSEAEDANVIRQQSFSTISLFLFGENKRNKSR